MNGPALLGVFAAVGILAVIYSVTDHDSPWPRISFVIAGAIGILALDMPWQATVAVFGLLSVGWITVRIVNRAAESGFPWEFAAQQTKRGLGSDWKSRFGGDGAGKNWRRRHAETEARYRAGEHSPDGRSVERDEALRILGLDGAATDGDIRRAHRRLMKTHHPDRGGSTELAAKLNQARELLLQ